MLVSAEAGYEQRIGSGVQTFVVHRFTPSPAHRKASASRSTNGARKLIVFFVAAVVVAVLLRAEGGGCTSMDM